MRHVSRFVVCLAIFGLGVSTHATAEPVSITSGFLLVTGPVETGSVSIAGMQAFSLDARVAPNEGRVDPYLDCSNPCLPGSTISIGAFLGGPAFEGTATLDGNSYELSGGIDDLAVVALEIVGTARLPVWDDSSTLTTAPFRTFGSFILPFGDSVLLRGAGIVSLWLSPIPAAFDLPPAWVVDQVRYDFSDDPAPIPEPATLTLLGIGLAATALRSRRRRQGHA